MAKEETLESWVKGVHPFTQLFKGQISGKDEGGEDMLHFYKLNKNLQCVSLALMHIREGIEALVKHIKTFTVPSVLENMSDENTKMVTTAIEGIKPEFNGFSNKFQEMLPAFEGVKNVANDLHTVIKFSLPDTINPIGKSKLTPLKDASLSDEGYAAQLAKACQTSSVIGRLTAYAGIMLTLNEGISDLVSKWDKLDERLFLTKEADRGSPELKVVRKKMETVKVAIDVLNRRRHDAGDSFFEYRKKLLNQILTISDLLFKSFPDNEKHTLDELAHAHDIRDCITQLQFLDDQAHAQGLMMRNRDKATRTNRVGDTQLRKRVRKTSKDGKHTYIQKKLK